MDGSGWVWASMQHRIACGFLGGAEKSHHRLILGTLGIPRTKKAMQELGQLKAVVDKAPPGKIGLCCTGLRLAGVV